jgi:membrane-associated phospholipid phosphatase
MILRLLLFVVALSMPVPLCAQGDTVRMTLPHPSGAGLFPSGAGLIFPVAGIAYGVATRMSPALKQFDRYIDHTIPHRRVAIDDYIQYAPVTAVYGLELAGIKAKHNFRDRTFVALSSHLFMTASVHAVKNTVHVMRPNGSGDNSFPSGHTATAFTGAHILFREYNDVSPWISVAGYATAAATGYLRIVNRRHWLSDVATGAGIGILCVEAGYLLLPVFRRMMDDTPSIAVAPLIGDQMYGLGFACRF